MKITSVKYVFFICCGSFNNKEIQYVLDLCKIEC